MIIVITGVSRGIGKALIKAGIAENHTCIGLTRNKNKVDRSICKHPNSHIVEVDWGNMEAVLDRVRECLDDQVIDVVINNAATIEVVELNKTGSDSLLRQFEVNAVHPFIFTQGLLNDSMLKNGAHIVNIGSMAGYQDSIKFPGLGAYSASKAALACLTQSMNEEWGERLSINCLCLGAVNTEMLKSAFPDYRAQINDVQMASYILQFAISSPQLISGQVIPIKKDDPN